MKLMLKIAVALAILAATGIVYAEVPDVSKWPCFKSVVERDSDYDAEITICNSSGFGNLYLKVSGELVFIYERRKDSNKTVYYNALKTNEGNWVEATNEKIITRNVEVVNNGIIINITDDNDKVIAKRFLSPLQK